METSYRGLDSPHGSSRSHLLALTTLIAAIGFTPWAWGTGVPWAQFAFRVLGLTALFVVALTRARGVVARSVWGSRVTRAVFILVLVSAASAAFSIHRGKSLEAMLNLLAITGLFLTAATLVRGNRLLRGIALFEILAAIPVAAWGIAQHFRPELVPPNTSYPGRALGPFGQPNRLGGYLIAAIPIALALSVAAQDRGLRAALLVVAFCLTYCLVATGSRGAWLGLASGLAVLVATFASWPSLRPSTPILAIASLCVIVPFLLLLPTVVSRVAPKPAPTPSWQLPFDPEREGSGAMRKAIWSGALAAAVSRPILGSGIGSFRQAFDRSKSDTMKRLEAEGGRTADQAHNHYLGLLAERGVLGLAAFALLGVVVLGAALAGAGPGSSAASRVLVAGLAASVAALLGHAALDDNLSFIPHSTILFANMGLLAAAAPQRGERSRRRAWPGAVVAFVAIVAMGVSGSSYAASRAAASAADAARSGDSGRAVSQYAAASALMPWDDEIAVAHARQAESWAKGSGGPSALREAEAAYRRALAVNGFDPVTRHELARLYLANPAEWGDAGSAAAIRELEAALSQNPYYAEIRNDLGVALLRSGDREGAVKAFTRASEGRRAFVDPLLNLAALSLERGDRVEARSFAVRAIERDPQSGRARALLARLDGAPASE